MIPCQNQATYLEALLGAMASWRNIVKEVIVVDDASIDETKQVASRFQTLYVRTDSGGSPYSCRNKGASLAVGNVILYLDAKCLPGATFASSLKSLLVSTDWDIVGGTILPVGVQLTDSTVSLAYAISYLKTDPKYFRGKASALTGNMLVHREVFDALGGFAEERSGGDVDFVARARAKGYSIKHSKKLCVTYPVKSKKEVISFLKRISNNGHNSTSFLSLRPPNPKYINMRLADIEVELPDWKYMQLYMTVWYIRGLKYIYQYL